MSGLRAVLFDMDGTLVDTERAWVEVVEQVAARHGYALVGAGRTTVYGRSVEDTAKMLYESMDVQQDVLAAELGDGFAARLADGAEPRPGALRLLSALRRDRVPTALVSASPRAVVDRVAASLAGHRFDAVYGAEDTVRTKPAPDPYLAAAAALGAEPSRCVAVEDTVTGVTSAEAAGCAVLAVPSMEPIAPAAGRTVLASLEQADLTLLRSLVSAG
ncbi:HAD family phosphatase [Streptomyces sp. BPTC-684]|uniref:HAD family hydrolase n=1 Tax=Streptomyces sp. BPTC-684 TaxID=3043734 RepID=UPI0024B09D85|nr:HAD family phosphatase [Streptomyces sp. BPTC-684]WHM39203.1 HAD family phosphatase [Streptomyces sp. BPTC-684]